MLQTIVLFCAALVGTLALTPVAAFIGHHFDVLDRPGGRKIHTDIRPRTGGIAFYIVFIAILSLTWFTPLFKPWFQGNLEFFLLFAGLSLAFVSGLIDDFISLNCLLKLGLQIGSASLAFLGGLQIQHFTLTLVQLNFSPAVSFGLTLLWFLLFINAVNLTDGLDGLAAGIVFFASTLMGALLLWRGEMTSAAWFAIISGSSLGFLRYNFSPAKVFLGDGGSYFLGYCMAAFSISADFKSQLGAAFLIPIIGLGIPVFDTMLAPIRRFVSGKAIFQPDEDHIHHRLLKKGLSPKKAVLILYGMTGLLCCFSLLVAQMRDPRAAMLLLLPGFAAVFLVKRLGYFNHISAGSFSNWIADMSYAAGFHKERRSFLDVQFKINDAKSLDEMWAHVSEALDLFGFDMARLEICNGQNGEGQHTTPLTWSKNGQDFETLIQDEHMLKLELPFLKNERECLGTLWLLKDMRQDLMSHYTLRRVEHLRRSISKALDKM